MRTVPFSYIARNLWVRRVTTLLTALDTRAPFAFYALALAAVAYRAATLPEEAAKEADSPA